MYAQTHRARSTSPAPNWSRLQRQCACVAAAPRLEEECPACRDRRLPSLQTRLAVNAPGDVYEQEADRIADAVLGSGASGRPMTTPLQVQRYSPGDAGQASAPPLVNNVLAAPGQPLDPAARTLFEPRFGHDFSRVRVHADAAAAESAREINALAYTAGTNIVFGPGRYDPVSLTGRRLLAHELAHVVQQTGGTPVSGTGPAIQRQPAPDTGTTAIPTAAVGSTDLRENASPLLASALGSTTVDHFALGSAEIPKAGEDTLRYSAQQILYFIQKYPRSMVHITGHTDTVGTDERNLTLGQERADAVSAFLQKEGVPADLITTDSKGEGDPVVPTKNDQAEPRNRRVNVFFQVAKSSISLGLDYSLKPPSLDKTPPPPPPILKPDGDFTTRRRPPYRDPAETEKWKEMEENQRKLDEYDRTHPRENKSLGDVVIDGVMDKVINPILRKLPLSKELRKKAEEAIRDGLESGTEKGCEAAIDALNIGSSEKDALKAACKAALKQKPNAGGKP